MLGASTGKGVATGRVISKQEATDARLNSLPLIHILAFNRLVIHSDDWGRWEGSAAMWRAQLFPRQTYVTEQHILVVQHDLATMGLLGFYLADGSEYALIYHFMDYQSPKTSHIARPSFPTPPREIWANWRHPRDARKSYDCPDIPYDEYQRVAANGQRWLPSTPRPALVIACSELQPFGGIELNVLERPTAKPAAAPTEAPPAPTAQPALAQTAKAARQPTLLSDASAEERAILDILAPPYRKARLPYDEKAILDQVRQCGAEFPQINMLGLVRDIAAGWTTQPLNKDSRPMAQLRNWARIRSAKRTNGSPAQDHESGEMQLG